MHAAISNLADFPDADRRRGEAAAIAAAIATVDGQLGIIDRQISDRHDLLSDHLLFSATTDSGASLTIALPVSLLRQHLLEQFAKLQSNHRLLLAEIAMLEKCGTDGLARAADGFCGPVVGFPGRREA